MQFKVNGFSLPSGLPFCQYCDRLTFQESWLENLFRKQLIYDSDPLLCFRNTAEHLLRVANIPQLFEILLVIGNPGKISW